MIFYQQVTVGWAHFKGTRASSARTTQKVLQSVANACSPVPIALHTASASGSDRASLEGTGSRLCVGQICDEPGVWSGTSPKVSLT
eukprot:5767834-Pyramimonas_sp.AAC.1